MGLFLLLTREEDERDAGLGYPGGRAPGGAGRGKTKWRHRLTASPARYLSFPIPRLWRPAASSLTSPGPALGVVSSSRWFFSLFSRPSAASGILGQSQDRIFLRLEDSRRSCSWGGHCGSCPRLGAGLRAHYSGVLCGAVDRVVGE